MALKHGIKRDSAAALLAAEPTLSRREFVIKLHSSFQRIKALGIKLPPKQSQSDAGRKSRLSQRTLNDLLAGKRSNEERT